MKYIKILTAIAALSLLFSSCSDDEGNGAGDAVVSFKNPTFNAKENSKLINIPLIVTGEPKSFPVVVELTIKSEIPGGEKVLIDTMLTITQQTLKITKLNTSSLEILLKDNAYENEDRPFRITIASAKGAEIDKAKGSCILLVQDNDKNPYEKLMGEWVFTALDWDKAPISYGIEITGGDTPEEAKKNFEKRYVINGFMKYDFLQWTLNYDGAASNLIFKSHQLIATPEMTGEHYWFIHTSTGDRSYSRTTPINATWSDDFNTITFDTTYGMMTTGHTDKEGTSKAGIYERYNNIVLVRATSSPAAPQKTAPHALKAVRNVSEVQLSK